MKTFSSTTKNCENKTFKLISILIQLSECTGRAGLIHDGPGVAYLCTPSENIRKPLGFLMFSGGIDKQHRAVMD